jgi:hypothetical protein
MYLHSFLHIHAYPCISMFIPVYPRLFLYIHVYSYTSTIISTYPPFTRNRTNAQSHKYERHSYAFASPRSLGHTFVLSCSQEMMDLKQRSLVAQGVAAFQAAVATKRETPVARPSQSPTKIIQGDKYGDHSSPDLMEAYINRDVVSITY